MPRPSAFCGHARARGGPTSSILVPLGAPYENSRSVATRRDATDTTYCMHETFAPHTRESNTLYTAHLTWAIGLIWQIVACPQEAYSSLRLQPTGLQAPRAEQEVIAAHGGEYTFQFISLFSSFLLACIIVRTMFRNPARFHLLFVETLRTRPRVHMWSCSHTWLRGRFNKLFAKPAKVS